jgi:MFS family permease
MVAVLCTIMLATLLALANVVPQKAAAGSSAPRPLSVIVAQPKYAVALFCAAGSFGVMVLGMTVVPLAMVTRQFDLGDTARVIQVHVLGMFIPSLFTGNLISRYGVYRVMLLGVALFLGHVAVAATGTDFLHFAAALTLLGLGWNFLYVGGTTLVTGAYAPAEKARAQAAFDLTSQAVSLLASLASSGLHAWLGWTLLNLLMLPWIALIGASVVWLAYRTRRAAVAESRAAA